MKILVANDDGIYAQGIVSLVQALSRIEGAQVYVAAPNTQKSATGHGITITAPIIVKEAQVDGAVKAWKIQGTPADCVKLGVERMKELGVAPDLVVSGINMGYNLGTDVIYSGTVSAAMEGAVLGYPAVAFSLGSHTPTYYEAATRIAVQVCQQALKHLDTDTILNVNVPDIPPEQIKGIRITSQGKQEYDEWFEQRTNPRGESYYWYSGKPVIYSGLPGHLDVMAASEGYISITPLHFDLTRYELLESVRSWFPETRIQEDPALGFLPEEE